jgi:hypothetical protein
MHRPLVVVHAGSTPPVREGTVAEDDFLTTRLRCCVWCGKREVTLAQALVYLGRRAVATTWCLRCRDADLTMTALRAMLAQRYGEE